VISHTTIKVCTKIVVFRSNFLILTTSKIGDYLKDKILQFLLV